MPARMAAVSSVAVVSFSDTFLTQGGETALDLSPYHRSSSPDACSLGRDVCFRDLSQDVSLFKYSEHEATLSISIFGEVC